MVHFQGTEYRSHTSCMSEAQKYQGHLYKGEKKGKQPYQKSVTIQETAIVPRQAYVEDEVEGGARDKVVAVIDVPPAAPSPPPAVANPASDINVFDYLVTDATPNASKTALVAPTPSTGKSHGHSDEHDPHYASHGYTYGDAPVEPTFDRYDSWASLPNPTQANGHSSVAPPLYVTPASKREREGKKEKEKGDSHKSDKKRKRHQLEELDISRARPSQTDAEMADAPAVLHSGLTGGLSRLLARPVDFLIGGQDATKSPASPIKTRKRDGANDKEEKEKDKRRVSDGTTAHKSSSHSRRHEDHDDRDREHGRDSARNGAENETRHRRKHRRHRNSSSSSDRERPSQKQLKSTPHHPADGESSSKQIVSYRSPAELFMSFVNKGPDSDRGLSINKALKRYHREREIRGEKEDQGDKDLWKDLRVRRNDRGEIVLFM